MPFEDFEAFEDYLESIDESYDEGSVKVQEPDIFKKTDIKVFNKVKRIEHGKGKTDFEKKVVQYLGRTCHITGEE